MSIIEKAAGRLDRNKAEKAPALDARQPESTFDAVEAAVAAMPEPVMEASPRVAKPTQQVNINLEQLHRLGMVTPEGERTPVSEEFRIIKRPLIKAAFNRGLDGSKRHANLIMVTSSLPGEGKTFCAINLAMSIAMEMDHTVLLVDADVARPSVPRYLGIDAQQGLMDVLTNDKLDLSDVMLRTNVDTLRLLPAGESHRNATELLASLAMSNLLDEIARRYPDRIVIFDSPPLLLTSEARALAGQMGQIVMVVEAETTTQHAVKDALRQLGSDDNVSLIYNKAHAFGGNNYGYGYN
ncbi:XrtA-associated tyrosine autokinase [Noviherbaspirillum pedocola]|nr:XrtA-associated tyrosine autokinase [Noviherbaspirillum pedocola]